MENIQNNNNKNLKPENLEGKTTNTNEEFLSLLSENGAIANHLQGPLNNASYELNIAIQKKDFDKIEKKSKEISGHIFWTTIFIDFLKFKAVSITLDKNIDINEEQKKQAKEWAKRKIKIEDVEKYITFYSKNYIWKDGKVATAQGKDSASFKLLKELLDYAGIEIVNE